MPNWIEWIGYLASLIVLVSLIMSSVKRLRWISLIGSFIFAIYGLLLPSYPVAVMNFGIVLVNAYYLLQMYNKKDLFELIPIKDDAYFEHFMGVYKKDMTQYIHLTQDISKKSLVRFFVIRNTVPAGLFIGKKLEDDKLEILVDYTTPTYRDFKIAEYIYTQKKEFFTEQGFKLLLTQPGKDKHNTYLEKMGFVKSTYLDDPYYIKEI